LRGAEFADAFKRAEDAHRACEAWRAALQKHEREQG
jgi:hypothetical protein